MKIRKTIFNRVVCSDCFALLQAPSHKICSSCHCDSKAKTINCASMNFFHLFTPDEWATVNANETAVANVRFDNNGIAIVTQFPSLAIRYLSFRHNVIHQIEKAAFKNLTQLEHLDLSFNRLTSDMLKPAVFEGNYAADTYEPLKALKILNLGNNNLHTLDQDLFEHFPNLEHLSLDANAFMVIDHLTVVAISSLTSLKVSVIVGWPRLVRSALRIG